MEISALERAAGGDFDAALADYEAQERRHAQERAQMAQQRTLTQQTADDNGTGFVIREPFDFDAFMKKYGGEEDDEPEQPTVGNVPADTGVEKANRSSNIPDVATGIHDPNAPFYMAGVPFKWDFNCIHRDTVSNANPTGDSLWPNPGEAFNPQDYPIPDVPRNAPNSLSSVPAGGNSGGTGNQSPGVRSRNANLLSSALNTTPAPTDHAFAQTQQNHPDAFPVAPTSRGILAAVNPFTDSGRGRDNQRGPSSRRSSRGFDKLDDIVLAGSGPLKQGTPFQIPPGGGLVQPGYQFTTRGLSNQLLSYPSIGRNLPLTANRLANNPLPHPSPSSSAPVGANPGQTSNQVTGSGLNNPDPNASSSTPAAPAANRRKRRLTAEELARRVKRSLE